MIIKQKKNHELFVLAVLVTLIFSAYKFVEQRWSREEVLKFYDKVLTYDVGFSSRRTMGENSTGFLLNLLKKSPSILYGMVFGYPERPHMERIDIDIKFEDYQQILADRSQAIKVGILDNPKFVKAKIRFNGETYRSKVRLKGDLPGHWRNLYRMSLRIKLKGKKTILGYKKFSLHKPIERQFPHDQIYQSLIRRAGSLASVHSFVHVVVNGTNWGVMNLEEHVSKELLEKQQTKESLLIKFGDEQSWRYTMSNKEPYQPYRLSDSRTIMKVYSEKKYLSQPIYRKYYTYIMRARQQKDSADFYDLDAFSRTFLVSMIWNNLHTLAPSNSRYYFNPYTLRLEPVTTDQGDFRSYNDSVVNITNVGTNSTYSNLGRLNSFQTLLSANLAKVTAAFKAQPDLFAKFHKYFPIDPVIDGKAVLDNLQMFSTNPEHYISIFLAGKRPEIESKTDPPSKSQVAVMPKHLNVRHYDDGRLELFNLLPVPVEIMGIYLDGHKMADKKLIVPAYQADNPLLATMVKTGMTGILDRRIAVETRLFDQVRRSVNSPTMLSSGIENPLLRPLPDGLPYLRRQDNGWTFVAGVWSIDQPLTIPGNLTIPAGTNLRFGENAYLVVKGSLRAEGREELPIRFGPQNGTWKGIYVLEATAPSILRHVYISKTQSLQDDLLKLTGGVTFYRSDVTMEHVHFDDAAGEDALNIVKSKFAIKNSYIHGSRSDGFDSDFSSGEIITANVGAIGGDALDFSGSEVTIRDLMAEQIHDKVISVGEGSSVTAIGGLFRNVGVGIAAKDGSYAKAENIQIESYRLHAGMSYIKKDFYGQPILVMKNNQIGTGDAYSRQFGTEFSVDGVEVAARELDVKLLYSGEVMRK